jgi:predicted amidophosphoribosyltransferase
MPGNCVIGHHVLLVDDVLSTGATLDHCGRALLEAGAMSVTGAVAAT